MTFIVEHQGVSAIKPGNPPTLNHAVIPYLSEEWAMEPGAQAHIQRRLMAIPRELDVEARYGADYGDSPSGEKPGKPYNMAGGIALITLTGPLQKDSNWLLRYLGGTSTRAFINLVNMAAADPDVTSILLLVASPGGLVDGTSEAGEAVWAVRQAGKKPIIAAVDGLACSAAYWIASQCSLVYAGPTDIVGSIGTRCSLLDSSEAYKLLGYKAVEITSGKYKAAGADGLPISADDEAYFQGIVNDRQALFTAAVKRGRKLSADSMRSLVDNAMVYVGQKAEDNGLIDGVATPLEVVRQIQKSAKSGTTTAQSGTGASMSTVSLEQIMSLFGTKPKTEAENATPAPPASADVAVLSGQVATLSAQTSALTAQVATLTTENTTLKGELTAFKKAETEAADEALKAAKAEALDLATKAFGAGSPELAKAQTHIEVQTSVGVVATLSSAFSAAIPKNLRPGAAPQTQAAKVVLKDDEDPDFYKNLRAETKAGG